MIMDEFDELDTESSNITASDILAELAVAPDNEVILVMPEAEIEDLKASLSNAKAKQNQKLKQEGLAPDQTRLGYRQRTIPETSEDFAVGHVYLHVNLIRP